MAYITEMSGGLEVRGQEDVIRTLVESLRAVYDESGTDMPKALGDVVFQLESRLEEADRPAEIVWELEITRISHSTRTFKVLANNEDDAKEFALQQAYDYAFTEDNAEYEIDGVEIIGGVENA